MKAGDWKEMSVHISESLRNSSDDFPQDAKQQLSLATEAVFKSWNGKRAVDYRRATNIPTISAQRSTL